MCTEPFAPSRSLHVSLQLDKICIAVCGALTCGGPPRPGMGIPLPGICPLWGRGPGGSPLPGGNLPLPGGPILASAQETCLCSHSMQACSKATSLSWPNIIQSRPGGSRAVSVMEISTWPCSPRAHACPRSLLLAHAIQQC